MNGKRSETRDIWVTQRERGLKPAVVNAAAVLIKMAQECVSNRIEKELGKTRSHEIICLRNTLCHPSQIVDQEEFNLVTQRSGQKSEDNYSLYEVGERARAHLGSQTLTTSLLSSR